MKNISKIILFLSVFTFAGQVMATSINQKQQNQRQRIKQGIASGELTIKETKQLVQGQRQLNKMERRAKADGVVTHKERARLQAKAALESRKIAHNKHDRQKRRKARN
ncbi:MAG: hypothetical protein Q9M92_10375 [Enterobacterales bacterium]|nr:hypothetical protein [Enterobacterales bacterium]